jgi:hypothetical protein
VERPAHEARPEAFGLGNKTTMGAERQPARYRPPSDERRRAQRWRTAVAEIISLQDDYRAWLDSLPGNLAESTTADALRAICALDLSGLAATLPFKLARSR